MVRIGVGIIVSLALLWISRSIGILAITLTVALWSLALVGVLHSARLVRWVGRLPGITPLLDWYAPPFLPAHPTVPDQRKQPLEVPKTGDVKAAQARINALRGIEVVKEKLDNLQTVATANLGKGGGNRAVSRNRGTLFALYGPAGAGKTTVAQALPALLRTWGALKRDAKVEVEFNSVGGNGITDLARRSLGGVLLIDDADRYLLRQGPEASLWDHVARSLGDVSGRNPGELTVILVGSHRIKSRILEAGDSELSSKFLIHRLEFAPLTEESLAIIVDDVSKAENMQITPPARARIVSELFSRMTRDDFRNARAAHDVYERVALEATSRGRRIIDVDDVRRVFDT